MSCGDGSEPGQSSACNRQPVSYHYPHLSRLGRRQNIVARRELGPRQIRVPMPALGLIDVSTARSPAEASAPWSAAFLGRYISGNSSARRSSPVGETVERLSLLGRDEHQRTSKGKWEMKIVQYFVHVHHPPQQAVRPGRNIYFRIMRRTGIDLR